MYFDLRPGQTCHSKVMHRNEVTHSDGTYEEKSRRWTWLTKWDKEKIPWYTHRLMHRKRVTSKLHGSYFRLMTIKHAIPRIEWAIELYNSSTPIQSRQKSDSWRYRRDVVGKATSGRRGPWGPWRVGVQRSWWQDVVEKASTQQKAEPLGLRLSSPGERERHNADGHKSGGQYVAVMFDL